MLFNNKYDMLDQFSKIVTTNNDNTGKHSSSKNSRVETGSNERTRIEDLPQSSSGAKKVPMLGLCLIQKKTRDATTSVVAEPLNDLIDVFDERLRS